MRERKKFDIVEHNSGGESGTFPTLEYGGYAFLPTTRDLDGGEDYYITSSGLTPVQELARSLGLAHLD